jgi:rhodanese-related sulfurtransferase
VSAAVDELLARVRSRISRVDAPTAARLKEAGAILVDTRPIELRREQGHIPGALVVDRNQLEWRLDQTCDARHPGIVGHTGPIVVFCHESYASSLAVASLVDVGVPDVHDLIGGFAAWQGAGLPVEPGPQA